MESYGKVITGRGLHSPKLTRLLAYIVYNHDRLLLVDELADVIWENDPVSNPAGALKNLVYRLRTELVAALGPEAENFIVSGRGSYGWNTEISVETDVEELEACRGRASFFPDSDAALAELRQVDKLYAGDFLPEVSTSFRIHAASVYFKGVWLECVKRCLTILEIRGDYGEMEGISSRAIDLDPLDEELYCFSVRALVAQGKLKLAGEQYVIGCSVLQSELGISAPRKLRDCYELLQREIHPAENDIRHIKELLSEEHKESCTFFCEFGVFKRIYQLSVRSLERSGISYYLPLVSFMVETNFETGEEKNMELLNSAMEQLRLVLSEVLRSSDVITRFSDRQYLAMLLNAREGSVPLVIERVESGFYQTSISKNVTLRCSVID